jgi:hypothetical protein
MVSTIVLTDCTWVAGTTWEYHYGPSHESRCMETTIVICNIFANVLHLVKTDSFGLCSQTTYMSFLWMDVFYGIVSW